VGLVGKQTGSLFPQHFASVFFSISEEVGGRSRPAVLNELNSWQK